MTRKHRSRNWDLLHDFPTLDGTKDHGSQAHTEHVRICPSRGTSSRQSSYTSPRHHQQQEEHHSYAAQLTGTSPTSCSRSNLCASPRPQRLVNRLQHLQGKTASEPSRHNPFWTVPDSFVWSEDSNSAYSAENSQRRMPISGPFVNCQ